MADVAADPAVNGEPSAESVVAVSGLRKMYGKLAAVDGLDLEIPPGSVFGLIGPNGAGKSTTLSILAALLRPTSGRVRVCGFDPMKSPKEVRKRIGYMPDAMGTYDGLQVGEYLEFFASAYRVPRREWDGVVDGLLELVDLGVKRDAMVNSLSRGMKQRLSLARALVHDPEILILDEPASGLDPRARIELRVLIGELRAMGKTVLISSHILAELEEMCTAIAVLEAGKLLASGTPAGIQEQLGRGRTVTVRFADGSSEEFPVAGDDEQAELLHRLVAVEGRRVVEFRQGGSGLEELFMSITEGTVQ